jgi:hypothetical protein
MMFKQKTLVLAMIAPMLLSCAAWRGPSSKADDPLSPVAAGGLHTINYVIDNGSAVGLVQAFNRGQETFLHTFGEPALEVRTAPGAAPLLYKRRGDYVVLTGVHNRLYVSNRGQTALVKNVTPVTVLVQNFKTAGVVQGFTDGDYTYLQTYPGATPELRATPNGQPLHYERNGEYLILQGAVPRVYALEGPAPRSGAVREDTRTNVAASAPAPARESEPVAKVYPTEPPASQPAESTPAAESKPAAGATSSVGSYTTNAATELGVNDTKVATAAADRAVPEHHMIAATRREYAVLQEQLREAQAELERIRVTMNEIKQTAGGVRHEADKPRASATAVAPAAALLPRNQGRYLLHFKADSAELASDPAQIDATVERLSGTAPIALRGRVAAGEDRTIARERAAAARSLLVWKGVNPKRIRVYSSGGLYVADNANETGRAFNRRVEIDLGAGAEKAAPVIEEDPFVKTRY